MNQKDKDHAAALQAKDELIDSLQRQLATAQAPRAALDNETFAGTVCIGLNFSTAGVVLLGILTAGGTSVEVPLPLAGEYEVLGLTQPVDNAKLDEANATIASLSGRLTSMQETIDGLIASQGQMKAPASLTNVQTRDVADLPRLDQLAPLAAIDEPAEVDTRTDVEKHLAAKAAAREDEANGLEGAKP